LDRSTEPIPGYTILERIGSGGYGEVWKAVAPGAIEKAIKFVYGYHDEERAARELKALNHIKEVRHPFLLSLDRIEVVDGQLVIVTELADQSLKDCYLAYRESGSAGIPRDELLVYLRDAADALDFMSERFGLQHLDVKPENLLLVGGRVKVADFGLVRDIHNVSVSLLGGLTPAYAPPEAFDGSPGLRSDQYSLAIVYQEMLSATLPFTGSTPARLMTQHINDHPDVSVLPRNDQPIVTRALAKSMNDRYPSCRAVIDSLLATTSARSAPPSLETVCPQSRADADRGHTMATPQTARRVPAELKNSTIDVPPVDVDTLIEAVELPKVELDDKNIDLRPTLFLGIGGTGGRVLARLRRRLCDRFGGMDKVPAMRMLLLDADMKAILRATVGEDGAALRAQDTLALPLRKSQEYRSDTSQLLQWLSRRWLYNIPRSLQPEGRRALGRLAFVDHAEHIAERLHSVIAAITSPEAIEPSAQATGRLFCTAAPRIFIVTSVSGGTGGGIVADVIQTVRRVLADQGLANDGVCNILMHSTRRTAEAHDLAVANAYACLSELRHDGQPNHPGALEFGPPEFHDNNPMLRETYLVALGEHLDDEAYDKSIDQIAEYLYLGAATTVGALLEKCRQGDGVAKEPVRASLQLRSFGLSQIGSSLADLPSSMTDLLCRDVIQRWYGEPVEPDPKSPSDRTETETSGLCFDTPLEAESPGVQQEDAILPAWQADDFSLDYGSLLQQLTERALHHLGCDPKTLCHTLMEKASQDQEKEQAGAGTVLMGPQIIASIDARLSGDVRHQTSDTLESETPEPNLDEEVQQLAAIYADATCGAITRLVETRGARIVAARRAAKQLRASLDLARDQARDRVEQTRRQMDTMATWFLTPPKPLRGIRRFRSAQDDGQINSSSHNQVFIDYAETKLILTAATQVESVLQQVGSTLGKVELRLTELLREISHLAAPLNSTELMSVDHSASSRSADQQLRHWVVATIRERLPQQANELERRLDDEILKPRGGLYGLFAEGGNFHEKLIRLLQPEARAAVDCLVRDVDLADGVLELGTSSDDAGGLLRSWIEAATPKLQPCASGKRLLIVTKKGNAASQLSSLVEQETSNGCSMAYDSDNDIVVCNEVEGMEYEKVAAYLIGNRRRYAELASRLHTRVDVTWPPLTQFG
jgi:serine/threonine protein kinase